MLTCDMMLSLVFVDESPTSPLFWAFLILELIPQMIRDRGFICGLTRKLELHFSAADQIPDLVGYDALTFQQTIAQLGGLSALVTSSALVVMMLVESASNKTTILTDHLDVPARLETTGCFLILLLTQAAASAWLRSRLARQNEDYDSRAFWQNHGRYLAIVAARQVIECTGVAVIHMLVTTEALEETASARPLPA